MRLITGESIASLFVLYLKIGLQIPRSAQQTMFLPMGKALVYLRNSDDFSLFFGFSDIYLRLSQNGQSFSWPYITNNAQTFRESDRTV